MHRHLAFLDIRLRNPHLDSLLLSYARCRVWGMRRCGERAE
jgi:hypothetical protein